MGEVQDAINKIEFALENDTEVYVGHIERLEGLLNEYTQFYISMLEMTDRSEQWIEEFTQAKKNFDGWVLQISRLESVVKAHETRAREIEAYVKSLTK